MPAHPLVRATMALLVAVSLCIASSAARAASEAVAASGTPLNVAVFVDTRTDLCHSRGYKAATERLAARAAEEVNKRGGSSRRPIHLKFFDNNNDSATTIQNIRKALNTDQLLAMIGLSSSQRAKEVFDAIGPEIDNSKVPFISRISVGSIFAKHRNVFSTLPLQEIERVPVMAAFIRSTNTKTIAFLGSAGSAYIDAIGQGLVAELGEGATTSYHRLTLTGKAANARFDKHQLASALAEIKGKLPGMLVVAVGSSLTPDVIDSLVAAGLDLPVLIIGRFTDQLKASSAHYKSPIYGVMFSEIPEVENDRILGLLSRGTAADWLFEGARVPGATGSCDPDYTPDTFSESNLRAVRRGAEFADMVRLVAASAASVGRTNQIADYQRQLLRDLGHKFAAGRGAFKGTFENWSFHSGSRARAQTPFVAILPTGLGRTQLAPQQFLRLPEKPGASNNANLKQIETLYLDVDLIRAHSVDNNAKTYFAEFYLAMRVSDRISIKDITFANALLDPQSSGGDNNTGGRQITIETLHNGGPSDAYPPEMRMYKVSGRFRFSPDFSAYPFDRQQFSIDLQPTSGDKTFIIQPPPASLRDSAVETEGWIPDRQYVSYLEDFVPIVDAFTHQPSIVPFYNVRFVWQMQRETTDYYIRVIVPLAFILIVAYLSIFIPKVHMEAIVTIQITALLSAVALYLSLPKIDTDTATISDHIFMFDYMMVSLMIVISILRINARIVKYPWINATLNFIHIVLMPAVLLVLVLYVSKSGILQGFADMPGWQLLGIG